MTLIVPCYNEEELILDTLSALSLLYTSLLEKNIIDIGSFIVFIDDGSRDNTFKLLRENKNDFIKVLKLSTNKGHQYALLAGLQYVTNKVDCAISIDADLQDDSEVIRFYSVRSVFKCFHIDFFEVKYNINKEEYLRTVRLKRPDIIVSSNSLIFGKELLNISKYCVNRHSSLLPSYGGLWPVFQAVRNGERNVGVTVHTMEQKIDKGIILSQQKIPIQKGDTVDLLYQKCFACSAAVTIDAIRNLVNKPSLLASNQIGSATPSYFSFPTKKDWIEFRRTKKEFI